MVRLRRVEFSLLGVGGEILISKVNSHKHFYDAFGFGKNSIFSESEDCLRSFLV